MLRKLNFKTISKQVIKRNFAIKPFRLPDLGEKIKEATVVKWHVKEGDLVEEYDTLAEVKTDKLFTEIPADVSGKIFKIWVEEDSACAVGDILFEIDDLQDQTPIDDSKFIIRTFENENHPDMFLDVPEKKEESIEDGKDFEIETNPNSDRVDIPRVFGSLKTKKLPNQIEKILKAQTVKGEKQKPLATPAVRALAKEYKIDLSDVSTRDSTGRVYKEDIEAYLEAKKPSLSSQISKTAHGIERKSESIPSSKPEKRIQETVLSPDFETIKMNFFEQGMVKSMTATATKPHFLFHEEFDITELSKLRKIINQNSEQKITLFAMLFKTFSKALEKHSKLNSLYNPEKNEYEYQIWNQQNISFAIDSKNGLAAPNIKSVQQLSIQEVQKNIIKLRKKADEGKLTNDDLSNGTICLSNIGTVGGTYNGPLTLGSQNCIVGIGKSSVQLRYIGNKQSQTEMLESGVWNMEDFAPREILSLSFSADHRVLNGADIAEFSAAWKRLVEDPMAMFVEMK